MVLCSLTIETLGKRMAKPILQTSDVFGQADRLETLNPDREHRGRALQPAWTHTQTLDQRSVPNSAPSQCPLAWPLLCIFEDTASSNFSLDSCMTRGSSAGMLLDVLGWSAALVRPTSLEHAWTAACGVPSSCKREGSCCFVAKSTLLTSPSASSSYTSSKTACTSVTAVSAC